MARLPDEDLFKDSTMSFGEHLDELRSALFKSVLVTAIGFAIGLAWTGGWVIQRIQDPLKAALDEYYLDKAVDDYLARMEGREAAGEKVSPEMKDREFVKKMIVTERMTFEEVYVDPQQTLNQLKAAYPKEFGDIKLPARVSKGPPKKSELVPLFLWRALRDDLRVRVVGMNAQEAFMIYVKASLISGIVLASPGIFYFLWQFVAAGLYPHEKSYVHIFLPFSLGLFLAGASLAFFFVFPPVLEFFFSYNKWLEIDPDPRISEWMSFVLMLPLAFGVSFQLPLVMLFLERIGIFTTANYLSSWRIAILAIFVIAMVITPTGDPTTLVMLAVPMVFLYFGGVLLCKWMPGERLGRIRS